jgi:MFS family permease
MDPQLSRHPWWRGRWFLRLLAVRMTGQAGDGFLQAALASYALFSDDQATAAELAAAAAVVLLPYSLVGPYAGVLLDRWSRRQVLLVGNLARSGVLLALSAAVLADLPDPVVYGGVLVALGINRFLLAGLSASLPHTVPLDSLTAANAVTPTAGTAAFVVGLVTAATLRAGVVLPAAGDHVLLLVAAAAYLGAGALALLIPPSLLGPDLAAGRRPRPRVGHLADDLMDGLRHLRSRPWPAAALGSMAAMRLWFGLVTVSAVLTLRNGASDEEAALSALGGFTVTTGGGFLAAALLTPPLARRLGRGRTTVVGLLCAATAPLAPAATGGTGAWSWWLAGAVLGVGAQGTKICVDAIVQAGVDDDVRGRVFSLYDMAFNMAFVAAAALAVVVLPDSGTSVPLLLACTAGLVGVAVGFARATRRHPAPAEVVASPR